MTMRTGASAVLGPAPPEGLRARQPQSVRNALAVLEEVARCGAGVAGTQVARNVGLPKATTYRLLALLVECEYLERLPESGGFVLGPMVAWLGTRSAGADCAS